MLVSRWMAFSRIATIVGVAALVSIRKMIGCNCRRPGSWWRPHEAGPIRSREKSVTETVTLMRRLQSIGRGNDVIEPGDLFGRDSAPWLCRHYELMSICKLNRIRRYGSNFDPRLTVTAAADVITAL